MSPLEEALQEQKNLINKGYSVEEVKCAATMIIAERLTVMSTPLVLVQEDDSADD